MLVPTFNINSPLDESAITVQHDGVTVIRRLAILDDKTGNRWQIKVSDGQIILEPLELEDKRQLKLNEMLK